MLSRVLVLLGLLGLPVGCDRGTATSTSIPASEQIFTVAPSIAPQPDPSAARASARKAYLHDRDAVRKARPKTEDEVTKIVGRPADSIIEAGQMSIVQWYYDDKPDGRDVLQVSVQGGKITMMEL